MDNLSRQFGLIVAYLLPGFIALAGIAPLVPAVSRWLQPVNSGLDIGPPVYALMAATAAGMIVSCFRWVLIDQIHSVTGVPSPILNYRGLEERMTAFNYWVEQSYRYYQFYANTLIAVLWAYTVNRYFGTSPLLGLGTDLGVLILCAVLFAGSRDALSKFRLRVGQLFGQVAEKHSTGDAMTNGADHSQGEGTSGAPRPKPQTAAKPQVPSQPKEEVSEKKAGK